MRDIQPRSSRNPVDMSVRRKGIKPRSCRPGGVSRPSHHLLSGRRRDEGIAIAAGETTVEAVAEAPVSRTAGPQMA
jgi:hypothetical protein